MFSSWKVAVAAGVDAVLMVGTRPGGTTMGVIAICANYTAAGCSHR